MTQFKLILRVFLLAVGLSVLTTAVSADQLGVLLMHGKGGTSKPKSPVGKLYTQLRGAGFIVLAPDMPWSKSRFLDKGYGEAMLEIDDYV